MPANKNIFFNHISIAEKTITGKQAINWSFQRQGFFLWNNAPARELDVCRPSVFTNLFFIQAYKIFFRKHEQNADNGWSYKQKININGE